MRAASRASRGELTSSPLSDEYTTAAMEPPAPTNMVSSSEMATAMTESPIVVTTLVARSTATRRRQRAASSSVVAAVTDAFRALLPVFAMSLVTRSLTPFASSPMMLVEPRRRPALAAGDPPLRACPEDMGAGRRETLAKSLTAPTLGWYHGSKV